MNITADRDAFRASRASPAHVYIIFADGVPTVPVYATAHAARAALTGRYRVDPAQLRYVPLSLGKEWEDLNHGTKFVIERVPVEEG